MQRKESSHPLTKSLNLSNLSSPSELLGALGSSGFMGLSMGWITLARLGGFMDNMSMLTVSLLRFREHQVYLQDAEEMVSDTFTQSVCSGKTTRRNSSGPSMTFGTCAHFPCPLSNSRKNRGAYNNEQYLYKKRFGEVINLHLGSEHRKDRLHGSSSGAAALQLWQAVMTGAGDWSTPGLVAAPVKEWVFVGSAVGGKVWSIGSAPEPLCAEAELPVAAGRRRQLLACIGLGMRGTARKIGLESPWAWTNADTEWQ